MKKFVIPVLCIALMLSFTGCADNGAAGRVTGVFYTYKEGDNTFATLKDATYKAL